MQSDHVHHLSVTDQNMALNSNSPSLPGEPLPLYLQKLPVRIPPCDYLKDPLEWYLNDDGLSTDKSISFRHVYAMMDYLRPLTPLCQGVVLHLVCSLSPTGDMWTIDCGGVSVSIHSFMRIMKYGRKRDPSLREIALGLMKEAAERCGMTLGEVKALLFVTTLADPLVHCCIGTVEEKTIVVQKWKKEMEKVSSTPEYEWGGGARQFEPILKKAMEYYEQVVMPAWCCS